MDRDNLVTNDGESIECLEKKMLSVDNIHIEPKHTFSKGLYAREVFIPKGTLLMGHKHRVSCMNILAQGSLLLKTHIEDEGVRIDAPYTFETVAGVRKLAYAIEDTVFINIFTTHETDINILENTLIEKSDTYLEYNNKKDLPCHL